MTVLETIPDPEMPISIVDLGLVDVVSIEGESVTIDMLPTFVGCPALDMIRNDVVAKVSAMDGVASVTVNWIFDPAWSVDRITETGRESLKTHGVTVPDRCGQGVNESVTTLRTSAIPCPFCESSSTRMESPFGPTRCRMIYYCEACKNTFEHMKKV